MGDAWIGEHVDAVIFDHDGTLVDSETITLSVVATMAIEAGAEVYADDADRFVGADLHLVIDEIARRAGTAIDTDAFLEEFRIRQTADITNGLDEIPGATAMLGALHREGVPLAVASNAPVSKMELCLGVTDLLRFIPDGHLISAYDIEAWKPDPGVFRRAAEVLGVEPSRCAVVEDSLPGIEAGLAAGMRVIALDPKQRFERSDITTVTSLDHAHQLLQRKGSDS
jgi:HAD superfamily hydrolase (TIGR01509 family)